MSDEPLPEPDRAAGAPHPRETATLVGQAAAEAAFLDALNAGRLPHSWLLTGPKGVGKATFAWRAARHLIAHPPAGTGGLFGDTAPPASLDLDPGHPVARRIRALSEPSLLLLRRGWDDDRKRLKTQLTVDEVRNLKGFFHLKGGEGRRVVIVDCADEMNPSAANALLKELEEPPENAVIFLVSHQPSGLLPTIRSRCRSLRFAPLGPDDLATVLAQAGVETGATDPAALAALSGGSAGTAIQLIEQDGVALYARIVKLLAGLPDMDRAQALKLSDAAGARGAEAAFDLTLSLLDIALSRAARAGATGAPPDPIVPGEAEMLARLAPDARSARLWAEVGADLTARARRGQAVNLDPAALIFDTFLDLDRIAARLAVPAS